MIGKSRESNIDYPSHSIPQTTNALNILYVFIWIQNECKKCYTVDLTSNHPLLFLLFHSTKQAAAAGADDSK